MKKVQTIIIAIILIGGFYCCNYCEHHYTRKACVVVNVRNNNVTCEDKCGFLWGFETDSESFAVGDIVDLKMFDNCSNNYVQDDKIIKIIKH